MPPGLSGSIREKRTEPDRERSPSRRRERAAAAVTAAMEAVLLLLVVLSPWVYGAVHPSFEFLLDAGVALLLLLWGARMLLQGQATWKKDPVALCLAGFFLLGMVQMTSFPRSVLTFCSPATARLYDRLLPEQPEALPEGVGQARGSSPAGSTPSLSPAATRRDVLRLLAVFLVFAVVRNNLASTAAFQRLSVVALVNGALLSLLGAAQFFSSPINTIYWTYPSLGAVFGPFINHNHFAEYVNLCIGLGIGLLLSRGQRNANAHGLAETPGLRERLSSLLALLHDPPALWICAALALMISGVALSQSRGGVVALVGAVLVCGVVGRLRLAGSFRLGAALLIAVLAFGLLSWFGLDVVEERLATLGTREAYSNRLPLWLRSLPMAADFPVWGTGLGTYGDVEPLYRIHPPREGVFLYDHAHNEYLEVLVEGGVPGLLLALLAIALVYRQGYRSLSRRRGRADVALTLGALLAFTTLVIHSFCEFGLHVPAIALLATVLCAHLCAQGSIASAAAGDEEEYRLRPAGLAALGGAVLAVSLALVLFVNGWKAQRVYRLQTAAAQASNDGEEHSHKRIALLEAAVFLAPDDAHLQCRLAQAHLQVFRRQFARRRREERLAVLALLAAPSGRSDQTRPAVLALQAYVRARDACPLSDEAQLGIASLATRLTHGDPQEAYLDRVKLLAPCHPERWYLCGWIELDAGRSDAAWASWRHSLALSPDYLPPILSRASARLDSTSLIAKVLPDDAGVLHAAAYRLYPDADDDAPRRPFLQKALQVLQTRTSLPEPADLRVTALVYKGLNQPEQSIAAYRELLRRQPRQTEWRLEFARYLYELHRLEDARHELRIVLSQDPADGAARELLEKATEDLLHQRGDEK